MDQVVTWGEENQFQMQFNANPEPKYGHWTINGTKVMFGTTTRDRKYTSSPLFGTEVKKFDVLPSNYKNSKY